MRSITPDDTVASVRGAFVACVVACGVACGVIACGSDPSLEVDVTNPSGLDIASTTISVYQSEALACDGVVFGDLDDQQLAALLVTEETIGSNGAQSGALTGMSRTDNKVIAARAFASDGTFVAAGCVEKGVVGDNDKVAIGTEPTVDVSLGVTAGSGAEPAAVSVAVTDPTGATVDGRQVSWTVFGPAGTSPYADGSDFQILADGEWRPNAPSCTSSGAVKLHPMPPDLIGGYAVQMRVEWAREEPPLFTSLTALSIKDGAGVAKLTPTGFGPHYCALHAGGFGHRLACGDKLGLNDVVAQDFAITVANGSAALTSQQDPQVPNNTIALYSLDAGSGSADVRDVYAVGSDGSVTPLFGAPGGGASITATPNIDDALAVPACGKSPARVLVHESPAIGTDSVVELGATGGSPSTVNLDAAGGETRAQLVAAGCIAELHSGGAPVLVQVFVVDLGTDSGTGSGALGVFSASSTHLYYTTDSGTPADIQLFPGAGVGFTGGTEPHLITSIVDATGVELAQVVMAPGKGGNGNASSADTDHLVERSAIASASLPDRVATGNFDNDGKLDQLWDIAGGRRGGTTSFEVAYAQLAGSAPLEALSSVEAASLDDLIVDDVNGDGFDDIIVTGSALGLTAFTGVLVVPTSVTAPGVDAMVDSGSPCP